MALKALDIFKLLPKTNCKKCGCPTCLAFAMKLAQKQASLDQCPDVTAESKAQLEGSAAPPIRLVTIGEGANKLEIGNETVMFRHDESFYHPPGIGVIIPDNLDEAALAAKIQAAAKLQFVRVGTAIRSDIVAVINASRQAEPFAKTVAAVQKLERPLVLMSTEPSHIAKALASCQGQKPLIHAATADTWEKYAALAKEKQCPLAVTEPDLDKLAALTEKIKSAGVADLILDVTSHSLSATLQALTAIRRLALKKNLRSLGYPCMAIGLGQTPAEQLAQCCAYIAKYAGIVLSSMDQPEHILPLLTLRQNLYTDPRKPIQVEPKLYPVGAVTNASPLLITTNFSLTYYTVEGEVEASRVPAYIGVVDTEGTSVLTAFAADKLTSEKVTAFLKSEAVKEKIAHHKVIIPGYVAVMSGALEEESGWEVMVGPREASGLPKYLKTVWKSG
ncbi:MAG: acetyl-CoA decarbonylase/synthase complex subunit gamma [Lentisphaerae bacterium]|nr:acetyl-CoA decarbonylase/synthase complex subunit gamma [Lentisphaerota bacterium]